MATIANYNAPAPNTSTSQYYNIFSSTKKYWGQAFKPTSNYTLTSAAFNLSKSAGYSGTIVAKIYAVSGTYGSTATPTGSPLATSNSVSTSTLATFPSFGSISFTFSGANQIDLVSGTGYVVTVEPSNPNALYINIGTDGYGGNSSYYNTSWTAWGAEDLEFTVSGTQITTLYWVGGTGTWDDGNHWSRTSGGASAGMVPDQYADAIFDASSFSAAGVVTLTYGGACKTLDTSFVAHNVDLSFYSASSSIIFNIFGDVTLSSLTRLICGTHSSSYDMVVYLQGASSTFNQNGGVVWCVVATNSTASVTLASNLIGPKLSVSGSSSFDSAGYSIDVPTLTAAFGTTLDIGLSTVTIQNHAQPDTGTIAGGGFSMASSVTLTTTGSTITVNDSLPFYGNGYTYPSLSFDGSSHLLSGPNTITTLDIAAGATMSFSNGNTQTVTNFNTHGTDASHVTLQSDVAGSKWTISKASGTVDAYFLNIKDSTATGGATWNATSSIDQGNNTGWNFLTPTIAPSGLASAEAFGTLTVTPGAKTITMTGIASAQAFGSFVVGLFASGFGGIASAEAFGSNTLTQSPPPPPPPQDWSAIGQEDKKEYLYKVYDHSGAFIGVWSDVEDEPQFTRRLNEAGTTMSVYFARSANTTIEMRSDLITQAGDTLTTQAGETLTVVSQTSNSVGEGTDIELNYNVDVYVQYGGFNNLITQDGELLITDSGDYLMAAYGSPGGARIFSGYIMDYTSSYGDKEGVAVTLASHGAELSQEVIRSGTTTTVTYTTTEIATQIKAILDANPGKMSYDATTIDDTGVNPTLTYRLNTKLEGIESAYNQSPDGWYWFGGVADPLLYLKQASVTPDHTFILGQHIKSVDVKRSIESLKNAVWFVGGDPGTGTVFKYYEDTTSQTTWRKGVERINDARYTLAASMANRANKLMGRYKNPIFTTPLTISSGRYDIETIELGQMVGFANFGNFIDTLVLQIVSLNYTPTAVTIELGELQDRQVDIVGDVQEETSNSAYETLPSAPS